MMIDCRRKWPLWRPGWRQLCRNLIIVIPKVFGFLAFFQKTKWRRKWLLALFEIKVEGFCWKKNWILFKTIVTSPLALKSIKEAVGFSVNQRFRPENPKLKVLNCPFPIVSFFSDCKKAIEPQNNWSWPWRGQLRVFLPLCTRDKWTWWHFPGNYSTWVCFVSFFCLPLFSF